MATSGDGSLARAVDRALEQIPAVGEAGSSVAGAIHQAVLDGGDGTRAVADFLHGTWLGHPLHPVLTDITIGGWVLGAAFDAVGVLGKDDFTRRVGDRLTAVATASAVPTAIAGIADYSTVPKSAATSATVHALLNTVGLGLYTLSLRDRNNGKRGRGLFFSGLALGLTTASAWLGGHLVYKEKVGVNHRESFSGPEEWTPVLDETALADGQSRCVQVNDKKVLLHRDGERYYAIAAVCSHAGGPLEEGQIQGHHVQCPWHDSVFDLRDGKIQHGPATIPQQSFATRVKDGQVQIQLQEN